MFKNPFEGQERLNGGFANLAFAGIALFLAWTFYQSIPLEQRGLLSDPLSLAILVISLIVTIQAGISKALEDKGSDMSFLRRFARHAVMTGIGPGAMAVCCLIGSYVAYILIAVGTPGQLLRFFACFLIGAWFVAKLGRIPILKDGKFNAPQLAFAIAIAAALFLLSGAFSGFLTESKLQLFLFALTYAFFSKLEFDGTIERLGSTETGLGALRWL